MNNSNSGSENFLYKAALVAVIVGVFVLVIFGGVLIYLQIPPNPVTILAETPTETITRITATPTPAPFPSDQDFETIIQALNQENPATIPVAYSYESGPYAFRGNGPQGFEIDIIREFERRWFQGQEGFVFTGIGVDDRVAVAESGDYSFVAGAISRTSTRCDLGDATHSTICTDTVHAKDKVYVMLNQSSNVHKFINQNQFCNFFAGQAIGFLRSTTAPGNDDGSRKINAPKWFDACSESVRNIELKDSRQNVVSSVLNEEIAGYFTDGAILRFYTDDFGNQTRVVDFEDATDGISGEEYTFLLPEDHKGLRELMDITLQAMVCDGTLSELAGKYNQYWGPEYSDPVLGQNTCDSLQFLDAYPLIKKP